MGLYKFWKKIKNITKLKMILIYSFMTTMDENVFICSYLKNEIFNNDVNVAIWLLSSIFYIVIRFYVKPIVLKLMRFDTYKDFINNILIHKYIIIVNYNIYVYTLLIKNAAVFKNKLTLISITLLNSCKIIMFKGVCKNLFKNIKIWRPQFKLHSIFGYYKSTRSNFVDFKNENSKNLKQ